MQRGQDVAETNAAASALQVVEGDTRGHELFVLHVDVPDETVSQFKVVHSTSLLPGNTVLGYHRRGKSILESGGAVSEEEEMHIHKRSQVPLPYWTVTPKVEMHYMQVL